MRLSSHDFVVFFLQTTPTVSEVLRSRSRYCSLPPKPIRRRVDAEEVSICGRSPKLASISVGADHP